MKRFLVDTSILVQMVADKERRLYLGKEYELGVPLGHFVSIVSIGELLAIGRKRHWGTKRVEAAKHLLNGFVQVPIRGEGIGERDVEIPHLAQTRPKGAITIGQDDMYVDRRDRSNAGGHRSYVRWAVS